ncbi:MAG: response regulator transcription factor [Acidobacteriia bacterium]|nr:response regulator transcription factor [Terriglobia bacterium]
MAIPLEPARKTAEKKSSPSLGAPREEQAAPKVLIVEDERKVARAIKEGLEGNYYSVSLAHTGEDGFFLANSEDFDLVVLDVMLPGRSGIEVLSAIRKQGRKTPVLLLTARDSIEDRVLGLDAGADDYLVKPFAFPELLARIRALLRRGKAESVTTLRMQDLEMDLVGRSVKRGKRMIDLTAREFELLEYFLRHQGEVVSREMLARDIWKEQVRHSPLDNVIDVHMVRLRRKVDEGVSTKLLHTVRGVGFVLKTEN